MAEKNRRKRGNPFKDRKLENLPCKKRREKSGGDNNNDKNFSGKGKKLVYDRTRRRDCIENS